MADKRSKVVLGLFLVSAVVVLALSLYTGVSLNSLVDSLEQSRNQRLLAEAQSTSMLVSADELNAIQDEEDLAGDQGASLQRRLDAFASLHQLTEVTFIRQLPSGELQYITSNSSSTKNHTVASAPFASNEMVEQAFKGSIAVTDFHDSNDNSEGLMAYSPVYDANGSVIAVAAVGIDDSGVIVADSLIRNLTIILLVCVAIVILAACANVLLQVRKEHELQESVKVQKLMIEISKDLASEQPFSERAGETLEILGGYLGASRAFIINLSEHESENFLRQHWNSDGNEPEADERSRQALRDYMSSTFSFDSGSEYPAVFYSNTEQLSPELPLLQEAQTHAFIWAPLIVQNGLWGALAIDFSKAQTQFAEKDIQLVESAATDLADAITRELYSEQREQALDHAVRASEAKSEFLSNMSHEMRTPMNAIIGMTSIALGSDDASRKDYCLEHIKDASAHLLTIINDVLDMSSLQSNELALQHKPFDLRKALSATVRDYVHSMEEHKQNFSLRIDTSIPSMLMGDKQRLSKVIGNLLSNATKFTPDEGSITLNVKHLEASPNGHTLRFEVIDTGIGVDPRVKDNLFGSFEQVDKGSNRKYGGTGLGLAICRRLVELMGGQIGVESAVDVGSTFFFTIRLEEDSHAAAEQLSLEINGHNGGSEGSTMSNGSSSAAAEVTETLLAEGTSGSGAGAQSPMGGNTPQQQHSSGLEEESISADEVSTPDLSDYRILLAEDIEINREVVLALLADSKVQIDITTNGIEVLEAIDNEPGAYDLVFMDLQMPEMDGLDATRRIRALPHAEIADLPIIAMTANVFQEDIDACMDAGMNGHIGKPINLEEIYRILDEFLPKKP